MGLIRTSGYGMGLSYHSRSAEFVPDPKDEKRRQQSRINQRIGDIALHPPEVMDHTQNSDDVDRHVEFLPALAPEPGNPFLRRSESERNHQYKRGKSYGDKRPLHHVLSDFREVEE